MSRFRNSSGVALIDAIVAMLVVGAGMLALAATQLTLTRSADVARQQGEASRLAQLKLEDLRGYTALSSASGVRAWSDLASGTDTVSTNTAYTRTWTFSGSSADPMRAVNVALSWADRSGTAQQLSIGSVISRTDPSDVGSLGFPLPANTTLKRPKNRNLNIPVPATDLGNGQSVVQLTGTFAVVFSNDSGYVIKTCDFTVTSASQLSACSSVAAYIVAGYVSLSGSRTFPTIHADTGAISGATTTNCVIANATNQNDGTAIADYRYYLCVISVPREGDTWAGRMRLGGMASGTQYLVCRFQYASAAGYTDNERNLQPYASVGMSLDNQNYIITTAGSCPTVSGLATTLHQDCRNSNLSRATDCPA